ncbi:MAG: TIGR02646 family protein [Muribaculaceae bacterium]|nr:TIGR02646 family protein [Muribaculaceae bacterium]MDE6796337.1 TIGR02646 family protein [Muribaculaceae bacterium]
MIRIDKSREPKSWTQHRLTAGAKYEATPDLRDSLLEEQGYICAYCMRRIPVSDKGTDETTRIEHINPQSGLSREEAMDYSNMVICCPGAMASTSKKECHCDRHKGENKMSFSPFDQNFINTLSYKSDGTIKSSNVEYDKELNDVLNLNIAILKANRKEVRKQLIETLGKRVWKKGDIEKILKIYSEKDSEGKKKEYCGVVIEYLTKKLRQLQ